MQMRTTSLQESCQRLPARVETKLLTATMIMGVSNQGSVTSIPRSVKDQGNPVHWLLITSRMSWKHLSALGMWAFADKSRRVASSIKPGDSGIVYLMTEGDARSSALGGAVQFTGGYWSTTGSGLFDQLFPIRIRLQVVHDANPPIPFFPFVKHLEFIKNKSNWGGYLQGHPARRLSDGDYRLLFEAVKDSSM